MIVLVKNNMLTNQKLSYVRPMDVVILLLSINKIILIKKLVFLFLLTVGERIAHGLQIEAKLL